MSRRKKSETVQSVTTRAFLVKRGNWYRWYFVDRLEPRRRLREQRAEEHVVDRIDDRALAEAARDDAPRVPAADDEDTAARETILGHRAMVAG